MTPALVWFRRALRLDDHPALVAACVGAAIPVVIADPTEAARSPASAYRQALSWPGLDADLRARGSRLTLRRGTPLEALAALCSETGARVVHAQEGFPYAEDAALQAALEARGIALILHAATDLAPRGTLRTGAGGPFRVFTPFWQALRQRPVPLPLPTPDKVPAPASFPSSAPLRWPEAEAAMNRGGPVIARFSRAGEAQATALLSEFLQNRSDRYATDRDRPDLPGTSTLSTALAVGEISARRVWHRALAAQELGGARAEAFLRELAWREFARELMVHSPTLGQSPWRPEWAAFPWRGESAEAEAWRRGRTGVPLVDAGMRELFATGTMHNRVRMVVASYLTKHLLTDWRLGLLWFEQTLTDFDPASNAMNWQWVAGCGPDASPFFRIFNPILQAEKFDPEGRYRRFWLDPAQPGTQAFLAAAPRSWGLSADTRPALPPNLAAGRARALTAFEAMKG